MSNSQTASVHLKYLWLLAVIPLIFILPILIVIFILFLAILIIITIPEAIKQSRLSKKYSQYLKSIDNEEFFCYTNRKTSKTFVEEKIIPTLDKSINIILKEGKKVISNSNKKFLSNISKSIGPCLIKVKHGKLFRESIHKELYETIAGRIKPEELIEIIKNKLENLRKI